MNFAPRQRKMFMLRYSFGLVTFKGLGNNFEVWFDIFFKT